MPRPTALLKRSLIFLHRWMGVVLAALFTLWFVSGIVLMYWSYPEVSAADRLKRAPVLNPAQILISPEQAYAALDRDQPPAQVRLSSFDARPVYRFGGRGGTALVYADDGTEQWMVDDALLDRAATAWARQPVDQARRETVEEIDQWTLGVRSSFPLYKYSWPDGQQVYLDGDTGDVLQYTTPASRFWAYLGAIPHWLYFTPLRRNGPEWFSFVVWSSGVATVAALLGVIVAVWMYSPKQRYRHAGAPTSIPYRGWKRWHTIIGLFFGVVTVTWAFSGLLSMGPFEFVDRITAWTIPSDGAAAAAKGTKGKGKGAARGPNVAGALRGSGRLPLSAYAARPPAAAVAALPLDFEVKELEFTSFDGEPVYLASNGRGETRVVPLAGEARPEFDRDRVMTLVENAAGPALAELRLMDSYDAYYLDRTREAPLPVIYLRLNDAVGTRYYIDPKTARVVGNYSARNWVSRWLYHGLHSLNFPWLYNHRPLWDIVVIGLMLGGTSLCVTSLWLAWRVLQRKLAALLPEWRGAQPNEDLI